MAITLSTSCSDFLDAENKSAGVDSDTYFSTEDGISAAKANAFYQLYALDDDYFELYTTATDLYQEVRGYTTYDSFTKFELTPENSTLSSFYTDCYNLEQYANLYIESAGEGTEGEAEGIFLRAYAYYLLTQQFGGVPYIGKYVSDDNRSYPKASLDSLYTIMEEQLTSVYNSGVLPETDYEGNVSEQAVACLLAKFYLAHAWDIDTEVNDAAAGTYTVNSTSNFSNAASWAVKAINNIQLTQTFEEKWSPFNEGNVEQIWSIQYDKEGYSGTITEGGHSLQADFGSYYGEPTSEGQKRVRSQNGQTEKSMYLWDEGDDRYEATFMFTHYNWNCNEDDWLTTGYFAYYNASDKSSLPIALQFFPWWYSEDEAEAEISANIKLGLYNGDGRGYSNAMAWIICSSPTKYVFSSDGNSYEKSSQTISQMYNVDRGGLTVKKFDYADTDQYNSYSGLDYRDIVVFDLSDMYLTAAEAYLLAGNESSALSYVNQVRSRANAGTLTSFSAYEPSYSYSTNIFKSVTSLDVILDERARELYGQLMRWVDLRRTKQLIRYNLSFRDEISSLSDVTGSDGEIKWLRPFPSSAIEANEGLTDADQNPGY